MASNTTPPTSDFVDAGTAGSHIALPPPIPETQIVAALNVEHLGYRRRVARVHYQAAGELHQQSHFAEWTKLTSLRGRSSPTELLEELADLGFAWRDVARLVGVTVQAIQKWRRGAGTTGENRHKLASLLGACDLMTRNYGIQEVASWFEMPLVPGIPVTSIDLWDAHRPDLVFDYASGHHTDPEQILTAWDSQWRDRYRSDFEAFRADDGELSIRPKGK